MTKSGAKGMRVDVLDCVAYADASGLVAVIRVGRLTYACNLGGRASVRLITDSSYISRRERLIATSMAEQAYRKIVDSMAPAWIEANRAMYADVA